MDSTEKFRQDVNYHIDNSDHETLHPTAKTQFANYITPDFAYTRPAAIYADAAIYLSARIHQYPLVVADLDSEHSRVWQAFMHMCEQLNLQPDPHDPTIFVDRIHDRLGAVSDEIPTLAKQIINEAESSVNGKRPNAVAAGAYYLASKRLGTRIKQDLIGNAANTSNLTIRKRYKEIDAEVSTPA